MKRILFLAAAVLFVTSLTSCSPYLIDRAISVTGQFKTLKAKDMPDFNSEHKWIETTKEEAVEIWKKYPAVEKAGYTELEFYEHTKSDGKDNYSKWVDCPVDHMKKNGYYENLQWETIYFAYASAADYELNAESPETVAENVKIFIAEDDSSFTKFVFDSDEENGLRIYKNGWLVYEDSYHFYENPSDENKGYDVHYAIVYSK